MTIQEALKGHKIICDGGFGTYYSTITGTNGLPEKANLENQELVKKIHKEYILAGARLIRTNTFATNTQALECTKEEVVKEIKLGYRLAKEAVQESDLSNEKVYIGGDIGPISRGGQTIEALKAEYELICDTFLVLGAEVLVFETFPDLVMITDVIEKIKKKKEVFIITQFCINQFGYSASGLSAKKLLEQAGLIIDNKYVIHPKDYSTVFTKFADIEVTSGKKYVAPYQLVAKLYLLLSEIINAELVGLEESKDYVDLAVKYMNMNFDKDITIDSLAKIIGVERTHFYRLFKDTMKISPKYYLINLRLEKAKVLLCNTTMSISEVAYSVGYDNYMSFEKIFKDIVGVTPSIYRRKNT